MHSYKNVFLQLFLKIIVDFSKSLTYHLTAYNYIVHFVLYLSIRIY